MGHLNRRSLTGIEIAIIFSALLLCTIALAFLVLNLGILTSNRTQSVIVRNNQLALGLAVSNGIMVKFNNNSQDKSSILLTDLWFYIENLNENESVNFSEDKINIFYFNSRCQVDIYQNNGTITTITVVNGDPDSLLETGEEFKIYVDFTKIKKDDVSPVQDKQISVYTRQNEEFSILISPIEGKELLITKTIPVVSREVMILD